MIFTEKRCHTGSIGEPCLNGARWLAVIWLVSLWICPVSCIRLAITPKKETFLTKIESLRTFESHEWPNWVKLGHIRVSRAITPFQIQNFISRDFRQAWDTNVTVVIILLWKIIIMKHSYPYHAKRQRRKKNFKSEIY